MASSLLLHQVVVVVVQLQGPSLQQVVHWTSGGP
jgi:hypothetical protein